MSERCEAPCCDLHEVPLLAGDVERLAAHTGQDPSAFTEAADGWVLLKGAGADSGGCVFLGTVRPLGAPQRGCTVHSARPAACRTYPFVLRRDGARPRIERDAVCPYRADFTAPAHVAQALADLWRKLQEERNERLGP